MEWSKNNLTFCPRKKISSRLKIDISEIGEDINKKKLVLSRATFVKASWNVNPISTRGGGADLPPLLVKNILSPLSHKRIFPDFLTFPKYVLGTPWIIKKNSEKKVFKGDRKNFTLGGQICPPLVLLFVIQCLVLIGLSWQKWSNPCNLLLVEQLHSGDICILIISSESSKRRDLGILDPEEGFGKWGSFEQRFTYFVANFGISVHIGILLTSSHIKLVRNKCVKLKSG